jgi:cytochrome P450
LPPKTVGRAGRYHWDTSIECIDFPFHLTPTHFDYSKMAVPIIPLLGLVLIIGIAIYQYVIQPAFLSPLAKIPNAHWSAPFSPLWVLNKRRLQNVTPAVHEAHERLGPIIRLAPNEISVNSVDGGIRTVYGGGYEKGDWYKNAFNNYGIMPMFSMPDHGAHSKRKRMLSNIYAKSTLQSSTAMDLITKSMLNDRLVPILRGMAKEGKPVEFYHLFCAAATDFVAAYVFGLKNASNYMGQPKMGAKFFTDYKARQGYVFWQQEMPQFTTFMFTIGLGRLLVPAWVNTANKDIEAWVASMCDNGENTIQQAEAGGEKVATEDWPTVYAQLRNALLKEDRQKFGKEASDEELVRSHRLEIASEMLDHTLAGFDTSSITLTFLAWELSLPSNQVWQDKLRSELAALNGDRDAKTLDGLPILHAILMETLRYHSAIPGNQPRITPENATLGAPGHDISNLPPNVRVQAQAWSLHRNPEVFPQPEVWNPGRWLESSDEQLKEMSRWFWAFGSGGRMCVGSNLAMLDMKAIIAGIWADFKTTCVDGSGMVHNGGYVAEPVGKDGRWCLVKVEEVKG